MGQQKAGPQLEGAEMRWEGCGWVGVAATRTSLECMGMGG